MTVPDARPVSVELWHASHALARQSPPLRARFHSDAGGDASIGKGGSEQIRGETTRSKNLSSKLNRMFCGDHHSLSPSLARDATSECQQRGRDASLLMKCESVEHITDEEEEDMDPAASLVSRNGGSCTWQERLADLRPRTRMKATTGGAANKQVCINEWLHYLLDCITQYLP